MKSKFFLACVSCLTLLGTPAVCADTVAGTPAATIHRAPGKVGAAVASLPLFNEVKPNTSARYYIYLCSAGWCGPCCKEMPHVVEAYKEMKKTGLIELILVDFDHSEKDAREYMSRFGASFPAVMAPKVKDLPGYKEPRGVPTAFFVDAEGNLVKFGHGSMIKHWQIVISNYEEEKGLPQTFPQGVTLTLDSRVVLADVEDEGEADKESGGKARAGAVSKALRKLKWFNGKPSKKAQYYIYLQSASWCGPCRKEMPEIVKAYQEMKKDGRVELVLLSGDRTPGAAKAFVKDNKAKFPATMRSASGVSELPGADSLPNYYPAAVIVKADGTVVTSGHGSLVMDWRKFTVDAEGAEDAED